MQPRQTEQTGSMQGRTLIREGSPVVGPEALEAPEVSIDHDARRVLVNDHGETFGYEFGIRRGRGKAGGLGWSHLSRGEHQVVFVTAVTAAEVMAVCRDVGREQEVAAITLAVAEALGSTKRERASARRLREEVQAGLERERVSLRALQARMIALLVDGETLSDMAAKGGFVDRASGRIDTTWLERRAGLVGDRCSRTGKVRTARTASYPVFCRLVAAVGAEPHEFDV